MFVVVNGTTPDSAGAPLSEREQSVAQKEWQLDTILDYMDHWAAVQPEKCFGMFLDRHGKPRETYTYQSFEARTRFLGENMRDETSLQRCYRFALVYPP